MKLTPFILFLILLFVLVISIVFSRFFPIWESKKEGMTEGLIDYNSGNTAGAYTTITQYSSSKQVTKLFDNIYFDTGNSYLLVVDGKMTGNTQPNVRPIENIKVYTPNGDTSSPTSILGTNTVNSDISKRVIHPVAVGGHFLQIIHIIQMITIKYFILHGTKPDLYM